MPRSSRAHSPVGAAVLVLAGMIGAGQGQAAEGIRTPNGTAFVDEFDKLGKRWFVSDGWSNGDYVGSDWRRSQVRTRDGAVSLVLDANPDSEKGFSSGEIQTPAFFKHGYFEVRLQAAKGNGVVSGFFTYTGPTFNDPWDEIDIEILGRNTRRVQFNYYTDGVSAEPVTIDLPFDAAEGFHTYAFEWLPDRINWYVDGELMHSADGSGLALPQNPQKVYLGMWSGHGLEDWLGRFRWQGEPLVTKIDCVSYQTERGSGPSCSTAGSGRQ